MLVAQWRMSTTLSHVIPVNSFLHVKLFCIISSLPLFGYDQFAHQVRHVSFMMQLLLNVIEIVII